MPADDFGRTDLHYAARDGDVVALDRALAEGSAVNHQDSNGWTALHFGAQARSVEVVRRLLNAGAKVDVADVHGNTPLFRAVFASMGDGAVIQVLRAAGADPTMKNKSGVSPTLLARRIGNYEVAKFFADVPVDA